jgi:hypothetical protein
MWYLKAPYKRCFPEALFFNPKMIWIPLQKRALSRVIEKFPLEIWISGQSLIAVILSVEESVHRKLKGLFIFLKNELSGRLAG